MSIFFRSPNLFPHLKQLIFTSKYFIHKKRPKVVTDKNLIQSSARNLKKIEDKSQKIVKENYNYGFESHELEDSNELVKRVFRLENAAPEQIFQWKLSNAIRKFQKHPLDTASAGVQMAVLTERVIYLTNILNKNRRDKRMLRDLQQILDRRRKMMNYLQRTDFHTYKWVAAEYEIPDQMPLYAHHNVNFKGFINKVQWSKFKGTKGEPIKR